MRIITGSTGTTHVTSNNDGEFNQAIFGNDLVVFKNGESLNAIVVDNNTIRVSDGDLVLQGRHALIEPNTTEDIIIETGAVGVNRNDLIVARYVLDTATGYENITLEVLKGAETSGAAVDPEITTGDIRTGSQLVEAALYRVKIEGINIVALEKLFTVTDNLIDMIINLKEENSKLNSNMSANAFGQVVDLTKVTKPYTLERDGYLYMSSGGGYSFANVTDSNNVGFSKDATISAICTTHNGSSYYVRNSVFVKKGMKIIDAQAFHTDGCVEFYPLQ